MTDAIDPNRDTRTEIAVLNIKMQKADGLKARFSFSTLVTKTDFAFLWHTGENEYRQKAFRSRGEMVLPVPVRFPKEGRGGLPLAHDLARKV